MRGTHASAAFVSTTSMRIGARCRRTYYLLMMTMPMGLPPSGAETSAVPQPGMSLVERTSAARSVLLGRVTSFRPTSHPQMCHVRLDAVIPIKGPPRRTATVYATGIRDGLASLWLFVADQTGAPAESYPVVRISPDLWPQLPDAIRAKVWKATHHAASSVTAGLKLHVAQVPGERGDPLRSWIIVENTTSIAHLAGAKPQRLRIGIKDPSGRQFTLSLAEVRLPEIPAHSAVVLSTERDSPASSAQVTLVTDPQRGAYVVTVEVSGLQATMVAQAR